MQLIVFSILILNYFTLICVSTPVAHERHIVRVKRIVNGRQAARPPPDDPVVFSQMYDRDARVEGFRHQETGIYNFLGIRYADPPIGSNRFLRPRFRRLEGDINATNYGSPCPQPDPYDPNKVVGNEDCLILNIYTPQMPDETTGLPVYVWIHPGGFRYGSAAQYDAQPLAQNGMIFVPVQYRLGTLGIVGDGSKQFSGNLAMFDMTAALRWVTDYISFFGGDPKQIKVIGHGSGAASAMYMGVSRLPRSGGDLTGIVSMSGSALSQYATDDEPVQTVEEIAKLNDCDSTNEIEIVTCLRKRSVDDIVKTDSKVETERLQGRAMIQGIAGGTGFQPHIETPNDERALPGFLTIKADMSIKEGKFIKVPLLIGTAKHETANGIAVSTLSNIYGSLDKFLGSMMESVNKLKSFLNIDEKTQEILKPVLPGLPGPVLNLNDYLHVPNLSPEEIFQKLTETTTDVLFNLPAVLSAENWSKIAPAFLYSFDFKGTVSKGINFLRGLPIVQGDKNSNYTGHGDELGYLFEANDLYGNPIEGAKLTNENDLKVRLNFMSVLKEFSRMSLETKPDEKSLFQKFTGKGAPFIQISDSLQFSTNFRFCELSMFGAPLQAIQSTSCAGFDKVVSGVQASLDNAAGTLRNLGSTITNPLGIGGGGIGVGMDSKTTLNSNKRTGSGLGGILG